MDTGKMARRRNPILASCLGILMLGSSAALVGCSGGGGGGDNTSNTGDIGDTGGSGGGTGDTLQEANLSAGVSNAETIYAHESAVSETDSSTSQSVSDDGRTLLSYETYEQGVTKEQAQSLSTQQVARSMAEDTNGSASNLIAVDSEGNSSLALESDLPIKANYTVTGPEGDYLYIALATQWEDPDEDGTGTDYGKAVASTNCALYKVKIADNSLSCVKEGLKVQDHDNGYLKEVSNDRKPIQFDGQGNAYFLASDFTVNNNWVDVEWQPRLYKMDSEGKVTALTQDNEGVQYFLALDTGEVVYKSTNEENYDSALKVYQDGSTITLTTNDWLEFFAADTHNTVMWGGNWDQPGIQLARPNEGGGYQITALKTPFGESYNPTPKRVIVGDDGNLYGVFSEWKDADGDDVDEDVLSVYRILPYSAVPRAQMILADGENWWDVMGQTTFQVSKGFLYFVEQKDISFDGSYYGAADVINVVNLETREEQEVLLPDSSTDSRYSVYNWQLSSGTLHFSALDQTSTTVVTGEIDTSAVKAGKAEADFLATSEVASASESSNKIQDFESVAPKTPEQDSGNGPSIVAQHPGDGATTENLQSLSVEFSKHMDRASVEDALSFTAVSSGSEVSAVPVWIYKSLHLVPDTTGTADTTFTGLERDKTYSLDLNLNSEPKDKWGYQLCSYADCSAVEFDTMPTQGWYTSANEDVDGTFASGNIAKYASDDSSYSYQITPTFTSGTNVRVEFSAKGYGWDGIGIGLWDEDSGSYDQADLWVTLEDWAEVEYSYLSPYDYYSMEWLYADDSTGLMTSQWTRYRLDVYGSNIEVKYATDCTSSDYDTDCTWTTVEELSVTDFDAEGNDSNSRHVRLKVHSSEVAMDNLKVEELDSNGTVTYTILEDDMNDLDLGSDGGDDTLNDTVSN